MLQLLFSCSLLTALIAACLAAAYRIKHSSACIVQMLNEFDLRIVNSAAQVAFFMFSISAAIAAAAAIRSFYKISGRMILDLDIIFFLSSLLLIMYHMLKEDASAPALS